MRISDWSSDVCSSDLNRGADRRSGAGTAVVMTTTKVVKTRRGKKTPPSSLPRRYVWPGRMPSVSYRTYPDFRAGANPQRNRKYGYLVDDAAADSGRVPRCTLKVLIFASRRSDENTSELQSLMRISYADFCLKNKNKYPNTPMQN